MLAVAFVAGAWAGCLLEKWVVPAVVLDMLPVIIS
jgi:hypothetical protein